MCIVMYIVAVAARNRKPKASKLSATTWGYFYIKGIKLIPKHFSKEKDMIYILYLKAVKT